MGELFDRYASKALALAASIIAAAALAEDIGHDAFVAVWQKIDAFDARFDTLAE